jgi:uncharacterized damage-inducible protein DinB
MKKKARKPSIGAVYPLLAEERKLLMATLDAFDEDDMEFRPDADGGERSLSVREIFMHLVDADRRLVDYGLRGTRPTVPGFVCDESVSRIEEVTPPLLDRDGIRTALERSWSVIEGVLAWPAQKLTRRHSPENPVNLLTILGYALVHQAQHRGQLWTYLEMLGKVPPRGR